MMSGGSFVAIFTLRVEPSDFETPVVEKEVSSDAIDRAFPCISEGLSAFVVRRNEEGRPVGKFRVLISDVVPHDDFKPWRFTVATASALKEVFAEHELSIS
jgi:hypothetical protein